jgi:CBS domain-containing protein
MRVSDAMTCEVHIAHPEQSLREVAQFMAELDVGALPVEENGRLVGMITDRDIAVRAVAKDKPPSTRVRDVMSRRIVYCYDDERIDHAAHNMSDFQMRRLPVVNREKELVGIISLADIATKRGSKAAGEAVVGISQATNAAARESAA